MNEIKHKCQFCKVGDVLLSPNQVRFTCQCGMKYEYRISKAKNRCIDKPKKKK